MARAKKSAAALPSGGQPGQLVKGEVVVEPAAQRPVGGAVADQRRPTLYRSVAQVPGPKCQAGAGS